MNPGLFDSMLTDSLWLFPSRLVVPGQPTKLDFQGGFIPQVATQIMQRWSKPGDTIVDWFFGSGTSGYVAQHTGRFLVGVDVRNLDRPGLDPDYVQVVQADSTSLAGLQAVEEALRHFSLPGHARRAELVECHRRSPKTAKFWPKDNDYVPHLAILHPPYANIINFEGGENDLSRFEPPAFLQMFKAVAENTWTILPHKAWAALVIGDCYYQGEHWPLGFMTAEVMRQVGFSQKAIIVKDIQNNEAGAKAAALKEWRHTEWGTVKFKHEYVFGFRKDER